jgi:hypothetical protein
MTDETQEHSIWSPSSSHGWRRCPGRINAEKGLPDRVGPEAAQGTLFHDFAEIALRLGIDPGFFKVGLKEVIDGHEVEYDHDMVTYIREGIEYIHFRMGQYGEVPVILMIEQRVKIEPWTGEPGGFGTSDICIIFPTLRRIIVFDWKYGKIVVSPIENDQLTLYCLGCWESFAGEIFGWDATDIDVEFIIWQPRVPNGGGAWDTTMEKVLAEGEKIKVDAEATRDPNAPRIPGTKQCLYCKAAPTCKELAHHNLTQFKIRFDDIDDSLEYGIDLPDPGIDEWTPERKAFVLLHKSLFERWFKKLHEEAILNASLGKPLPLTKVVAGNAGHRYWKNKKKAEEELIKLVGAAKAKKVELITPAVAQKLVGDATYKKYLKEFVDQPAGKPIVVPETDPRKEIPTIGQEFDRLMADEMENGD